MTFSLRWVLLVLMLFAVSACSNEHRKGSDREVIQKQETATPHHRLYFSYKNCEFQDLAFMGWRKADAFAVILPETIGEDISWKYLRVTLKGASANLHQTVIENPIYAQYSTHQGFEIFRCKADFFVDVPSVIDVTTIREVVLSAYDEQADFSAKSIKVTDEQFNEGLSLKTIVTAESALKNTPYKVFKVFGSAPADKAWDMVVLGDGYTDKDISLLTLEEFNTSSMGRHIDKVVQSMMVHRAFRLNKENINIWAVVVPSQESGIDIPGANVFKKTFYETSLGASCLDRLPVIKNGVLALEMASMVPFDQVLMLVNSNAYGGSGGSFAVTTVNYGYHNVVIHELGHSIAGLSDQYYYFDDQEVFAQKCEDDQYEDYVSVVKIDDYANALGDEDRYLSPNLTVFSSATAKWQSLLSVNFVPVYFSYPKEKPIFDASTSTVSWTVDLHANMTELIFLPGSVPEYNSMIGNFEKLYINDELIAADSIQVIEKSLIYFEEGQSKVFDTPLSFYKITKEFPKNTTLNVKLKLNTSVSASFVNYFLADASSFKFASTVFEPNDIGVFQGAFPSLDKVFRSSYLSIMMNSEFDFDRVEEGAVLGAIRKYTTGGIDEKPQEKY